MRFKLIIALIEDHMTNPVLDAARHEGATGSTIITQARGEGIEPTRTFLGLSLEAQRDVCLFLVEEHLSRKVLEKIAEVAKFDEESGAGIAFQIDVEDAVGVSHQVRQLTKLVEDEI